VSTSFIIDEIMPPITKPNLFTVKSGLLRGVKDGHGDDIVESKIQYCQSCLQYGIKSVLKRRMFNVEQGKDKPKLVPASVPDADRFRQCYHCGDIVPIYNVKTESKIEDFVETIDNPFDMNPGNMDGFTPGRDRLKLNKSKSIYKRKKAQIDAIKDEDIRTELKNGATLTSYFDV
jgi:hypothetical protein